MTGTDDYRRGNVAAWQRFASEYAAWATEAWEGAPRWGIWKLPETELRLLPDDMHALDCVELGCGTGYVSAWIAKRGGRAVGLDPTPNQLATARAMRTRFGLPVRFVRGFAETLPFPDRSFDFAISEYGAALWSDPYRWLPEAARVLRPGGQLCFLTNSPLVQLCTPDVDPPEKTGSTLLRPYFGLYRTRWKDSIGEEEFHLTHGDWIALFRRTGLAIERLLELQAPPGATTSYPWANPEWAQRWPSEEVWVLRRER